MDARKVIGLDFETYCALDLKEVGLERYVNHPSFLVTLASVSTWAGESTWEFPADKADDLRAMLHEYDIVVAHNAGFEKRVLKTMGIVVPMLHDSAVVAAVAGADRHLAGAARQLMNEDKLDEDRSLLNLFAKRQKGQSSEHFNNMLIHDNLDKWEQYKRYCERDAKLSRGIYLDWLGPIGLHNREMRLAEITLAMNETGWPVDIDSVHEMRRRYIENLDYLQDKFARDVDADLNIGSHAQVKKWCEERGIRSRSFDKQNVERMLKRLRAMSSKRPLTDGEAEVVELLVLKQALGGSSLSKLETILNVAHDGRVYDQYVHAGAAQTLRTSGRSVQMQNLPRLPLVPRHMEDLHYGDHLWSNEDLTENLRQVFRSSRPNGKLVVADFASIESRALAYLSGEDWKVEAYRQGADVYKAQAMKIFGINSIDLVSKEQRTTGKVGELSCGYGAGPVAVRDFAAKMNVEMTEVEAGTLVNDWRDANPNIVDFWSRLGDGLLRAVNERSITGVQAAHGITIKFQPTGTPGSLIDQMRDALSIRMDVWKNGACILSRVFHGCYLRGRDIHYHKPSHLKGGRPWKQKYTDPKTKRQVYYKLYGGKLAGILTQSLCREIFFDSLAEISSKLHGCRNVALIGQFHDEVVVDWWPGSGMDMALPEVMNVLRDAMSYSEKHPRLPMGVEVKYDHRYTK